MSDHRKGTPYGKMNIQYTRNGISNQESTQTKQVYMIEKVYQERRAQRRNVTDVSEGCTHEQGTSFSEQRLSQAKNEYDPAPNSVCVSGPYRMFSVIVSHFPPRGSSGFYTVKLEVCRESQQIFVEQRVTPFQQATPTTGLISNIDATAGNTARSIHFLVNYNPSTTAI